MQWQSMESAPKGEWVERKCGEKGVTLAHLPTRIIGLMSNGDWTVTYWLAGSQRWNMFTADSPPLAWCIPPSAESFIASKEVA